MKITGVIPARYGSTRFPGKPLVLIKGKTMIRRVYEQAAQARCLDSLWVATDDLRIEAEVKSFGGHVLMTSPDHPTGTDRILELVDQMPGPDAFINIQGDEPFIDPSQIDLVGSLLSPATEPRIGTLIKKMEGGASLANPNIVKVATATDGRALYFSRSIIPHLRNPADADAFESKRGWFRHIGIYGYTRPALRLIAQMKPGALEQAESLEQLRWLENGLPIYTRVTEIETVAIDTPEDLAKIH